MSKELDTTFRNVWGGRSLENTKADISEIKYRLTNMYTERVAKIKKDHEKHKKQSAQKRSLPSVPNNRFGN